MVSRIKAQFKPYTWKNERLKRLDKDFSRLSTVSGIIGNALLIIGLVKMDISFAFVGMAFACVFFFCWAVMITAKKADKLFDK